MIIYYGLLPELKLSYLILSYLILSYLKSVDRGMIPCSPLKAVTIHVHSICGCITYNLIHFNYFYLIAQYIN